MTAFRRSAAILLAVAILCISAAVCGCTSAALVTDADPSERLTLNCSFDILRVGEQRRYYPRVRPEGSLDDLVFSVADTSVAVVGEDGLVTALSAGETELVVRSPDAACEDRMQLAVYDDVLFADSDSDAESRLAAAASREGGASVALRGDFLVPVYVKCNLSLTAIGEARLGKVVVESGGSLLAKDITFFDGGDVDGGVVVCSGASFDARGCMFAGSGSDISASACRAEHGFGSAAFGDCDFAGWQTAVEASPSDGALNVINNVFRDCALAILVDIRDESRGADCAMQGEVRDNIFVDCERCASFLRYSDLGGELDFEDEDVVV